MMHPLWKYLLLLSALVLSAAAAPLWAQEGEESEKPAVTPGDDGYYTMEQLPALRGEMMEQMISFRGKVAGFRESWSETAPNVIMLAGDGEGLQVVYWDEPEDSFEEEGTPVFVTGILQEYDGQLQIKVDDVETLSSEPLSQDKVAEPSAPQDTVATGPADSWPGVKSEGPKKRERIELEPGTEVELDQISALHAGNSIEVSGAVYAVIPLSEGLLVILRGDNAMLSMRAPESAGSRLEKGKLVRAEGEVAYNRLRSQPELVVEDPAQIEEFK